ncbi:hypothetical protein ACGYKB_18440 [Sulfitobacter sp. 916]|uniref:hypothetical protein n=1 Tax=Sulfitobacter sp. 916 TaxID=3368559 RepID=UPI00374638E3
MTLISLATAIFALKFGFWIALVLYVGLVTTLVGALTSLDRPIALLLSISAVTLGPLSGPVLLLATSPLRWPAQPTPEPDLYTPTPAERIAQDIAQGRRRMRNRTVPALMEVFTTGELCAQQAALASIARHFRPELRPALERAQASDIPVIRTQSAAVLTQLRDVYAKRARKILANKTGLRSTALAAEIQTIAKSGFVDPQTLSDLNQIMHGPQTLKYVRAK